MFHIKIEVKIIILMLLLSSSLTINAVTIGSNSVPSREAYAILSGASNTIAGFAGMYNGFALANSIAAVTFNSRFPVSAGLIFNGGTMTLGQDLLLNSNFVIGSVGNINGSNYSIEFAPQDQMISLPYVGQISLLNKQNTVIGFWSLDWSPDNNYVAAGFGLSATQPELKVYAFDGTSLTLTASFDIASNGYDLGWQPTATTAPYYLVVGNGAATVAYQFTPTSAVPLVQVSSVAVASTSVTFHPSGAIFARSTNTATAPQIRVYNVSAAGVLTANTNYTFSPATAVQTHTLRFDNTGDYLAAGCNSGFQLQILSWNGVSLTLTTSANVGQTVSSLAWSPDGSLLALGLANNQLRIYSFNRSLNTLTPLPTYTTQFSAVISGFDWSPDGRMIAVNLSTAINSLRLFQVDRISQKLLPLGLFNLVFTGAGVAWSGDGNNLATGDAGPFLSAFNFLPGIFTISNANVVYNSSVQLRGTLTCSGSCIIDCGGYTFDLNSQTLNVAAGASLLLKNMVLEGIVGNNLQCLDSVGTISFDNVTCLLNNTLTVTLGHLAIIGDCTMTGTGKFVYTSNQASTIVSGARWYFDRGMTFSYFPQSGANNLINFVDSTAQLYLYETALHAQSTGLQFTNGTLTIDGRCPFYSDALTPANGILFGDNVTNANNMNVMILPESGIDVGSGYVVYQNIGS